jgi:hypothetical protein
MPIAECLKEMLFDLSHKNDFFQKLIYFVTGLNYGKGGASF